MFDVTRGIDDETDCSLTGSQNAMGQGRHLQLSAMLMAGKLIKNTNTDFLFS